MSTLTSELSSDPLGRGYAQMNIEQIIADLSERRYPALTVPVAEVDAYLDTYLLRFVLKQLRDNVDAPVMARAAADTALELRDASYRDIRVDVAAPLLDVLVSAGVLTEIHKVGLLALADNKLSRCDQLGITPPNPVQVREAAPWL